MMTKDQYIQEILIILGMDANPYVIREAIAIVGHLALGDVPLSSIQSNLRKWEKLMRENNIDLWNRLEWILNE